MGELLVDIIALTPLLVVLAFIAFTAKRRDPCPDCGARLRVFVSPFRKTRRMWLEGGFVCTQCGCETDRHGRRIATGARVRSSVAVLWAGVCVLLVTASIALTIQVVNPQTLTPPANKVVQQPAP